jgi:tRNA modification GTPase
MSETRLACLTPPGQAALAVLGLHGPLAWDAVRAHFRTRWGKELPGSPQPGRFWLGRLGTDVADEVVVSVRAVSPVPSVEVHCHGGREVVRFLTDLLTARGLRPCPWEEFLSSAGMPAWQAEAAAALAHAPTVRTAAILLDQYHGAFAAALRGLLAALTAGDIVTAKTLASELSRNAPLGRHLTEPWRVAIAGAPNVGKSSLVNALAGYTRSIVDATPGTTRDVVTTRLALDGWPVELADTAGQRPQAGMLEGQGIALARQAVAAADLCLWLLDGSTAPLWPEAPASSVLLVVNKTDLPPAWDWAAAPEALRISARTGAGLDALSAAISRRLVPQPPAPGAAVPFTVRQCAALEEAVRRLEAGDGAGARAVLAALGPGENESAFADS